MSNILTVGLVAEGSTDIRFLQSLAGRCFAEVALACPSEIEVYPVVAIEGKGQSFREKVKNAAIAADKQGINVLADRDTLLEEIGTDKSAGELGINRPASSYANPKLIITEALRIASEDLPRRRRRQLKISELYLPIGQKCQLEILRQLPSFQKFEMAVFDALRQLNYLH